MGTILKNFNKEIRSLWLTITTRCNLDCTYCYVVKDNREMSEDTAFSAVDLLMRSPGTEKRLQIYGGESLLCFDLIKAIVKKARQLAKILGKEISVRVATNGALIGRSHLIFFRENHVKLAISIDGQQQFHDQARLTKGKLSVHQHIVRKIPEVLSVMKPSDVSVLVGILPTSSFKMHENLRYLADVGFTNFNLEMIKSQKYVWGQEHVDQFKTNLSKFIKYIESQLRDRKFIFLNEVSKELSNRKGARSFAPQCPFMQNLEIYPDGEMAFSPFLLNQKNRSDYIVGNISEHLNKSYRLCTYAPDGLVCKNCWKNYHLSGGGHDDEECDPSGNKFADVVRLRDIFAIYFARKINERAKVDQAYKQYKKEAKKMA